MIFVMQISALLYISVFLLIPRRSSSSILIPSTTSGTTAYQSQPAGFGTPIDASYYVYAHLQIINSDEHLCGGKHDLKPSDYTNNYGLLETAEKSSPTLLRSVKELSTFNITSKSDIWNYPSKLLHLGLQNGIQEEKVKKKQPEGKKPKNKSPIIIPPDELPVVLLAKRGQCEYETKARTAMAMSPLVKYVIVIAYSGSLLDEFVVMEAGNPSNIDVGLLYVPYDTGEALKGAINSETEPQKKDGGVIIAINGVQPSGSIYDSSQKFMLASLAGFFLFISFFGCCMMCCQNTYIYRDGSTITIGFRSEDDIRRMNNPTENPLLTDEQVMRLPEVEYKGSNSDNLDQPLEITATTATEAAASTSTTLSSNIQQTNTEPQVEPNQLTEPILENMTSNTSCSICLEDYEIGEKLRSLPCGHLFHHECIHPWLTERFANCPLCKTVVSSADLDSTAGLSANETPDRSYGRTLMRLPNWIPSWLSNRIPVDNDQAIDESNNALQTPLVQNTQPSPNLPSGQAV